MSSSVAKLADSRIAKLADSRIAKLADSRIAELSDSRIAKTSYSGITLPYAPSSSKNHIPERVKKLIRELLVA